MNLIDFQNKYVTETESLIATLNSLNPFEASEEELDTLCTALSVLSDMLRLVKRINEILACSALESSAEEEITDVIDEESPQDLIKPDLWPGQ